MHLIPQIFKPFFCAFFLLSCQNSNNQNASEESAKSTKTEVFPIIEKYEDALTELKRGNQRFLDNKLINTNYHQQIKASKKGQKPYSVILSCMDSRIPPEIIFDQGIGKIFVIRNAGNLEDLNVLGSIEYAVKFSGTKLIIVMAHNHCGAVKGAIKDVEGSHLSQLVKQIKPSIPPEDTTTDKGNHGISRIEREYHEVEEEIANNNARNTLRDILAQSNFINQLHEDNEIKLVHAFYDIESGKVSFFEIF